MSLTEAQLAKRRTGLTATDVVVLASGSDWHGRTIHDVWRAKVLGKDDFEPTEATELGDEFEPIVIRRAAAKLGIEVDRGTETISHPEHSRYLCTPDAIEKQHGQFLQVKVVGYHMARAWGDTDTGAAGLPEVVFVQCAWEMFVGQTEIEHVGALLGTEVRTYRIDRARDGVDDLVGGLREIGDQFWTDYVEPRRPPPVDGSEGAKRMLAAIWPMTKAPAIRATPEAERVARAYFTAHAAEAEAEKAKKLAQQQLVALVGKHAGLTGDGWRLKYDWRDPTEIAATTRKGYRHFDCRATKGK